jgi:hypothetical protein
MAVVVGRGVDATVSTQEGGSTAEGPEGGGSKPSDSVAAVLATTWAGDAEEMYRYLTDDADEEDLTYEDWTGPMAASAGRICLRIDSAKGQRWVRWTPDGGFDCCVPWRSAFRSTWRGELEGWIDAHDVEPVLVEETPFARPPETGEVTA